MSEEATPRPRLSVVIPAFNEANRLGSTLDRLAEYLTEREITSEIIVVDDGSTDETAAIAESFGTRGVRALHLAKNQGKGAALRHGVLASHGEMVLLCDADLSTPIEDLEKLEPHLAKCPLVVGSRALPESRIDVPQPIYRQAMGKTFNFLLRSVGLVSLEDTQCGFKLLEGGTARSLFEKVMTPGFAFDVELLWLAERSGLAIAEVAVDWNDSAESRVRPWIDPAKMVGEIIRFRWLHGRSSDRSGSNTSPSTAGFSPSWALAVGFALTMAIAFQGTRGLFDPDEGFYSNVALGMVDSGDWWVPRLNNDIFLDKPPLIYWSIALGIRMLGSHEWAARLVQALWFAGTALLVGLIARGFWGRSYGPLGTIAYATMFAPFIAGNVLTPDTELCFAATLLVYAFWNLNFGESSAPRWLWSLPAAAGFGLGILAKGPAIALVLCPVLLHLLWLHGLRGLFRGRVVAALALGALIGGSWYVSVGLEVPGAFAYWFDNQIAGRLWSSSYQRSPQWWAGITIYLPCLLVGGLPWTAPLIRGLARNWKQRHQREIRDLLRDDRARLLALWFFIPLAVLLVAKSRLPLYVLPIMPPFALVAVRLAKGSASNSGLSRRAVLSLAVWAVLLVGLKAGLSHWPVDTDNRLVALNLQQAGISPATPLLLVDTRRNGLRLYGYDDMTVTRLENRDYPYFVRLEEVSQALRGRLADADPLGLVIDDRRSEALSPVLTAAGLTCGSKRVLGERLSVLACRPASVEGG